MRLKASYFVIGFLVLVIGVLAHDAYMLYKIRSAPFDAPDSMVVGPANADLTIVEFVDYACPYCQSVHPLIMEAMERDGSVRLIVRPILSDSDDAVKGALLAYAAAKQGQYMEMHAYILENNLPPLTEDQAVQDAALELGLDQEQLLADAQTTQARDAINQNMQMLINTGMNAIPAFLIGPDIYFIPEEDVSADDFLRLFSEARGL